MSANLENSAVATGLEKVSFHSNLKEKAKCLPEEALQTAEKISERERRKEKIYPFESRVPKNSKER